jgi:tetratricopeptide (TPR) repeat protein
MLKRKPTNLICVGCLSLLCTASSGVLASTPDHSAEDLWHSQCERGDQAEIERNYGLAEKLFQESLVTAKPFGTQSKELQTSTARLGTIKLLQGQFDAAEPFYLQALRMVTDIRKHGEPEPDSLGWLDDFGDAYETMSKKHPEKEQMCLEHCIAIRDKIAPGRHSKLSSACAALAAIYIRTAKYPEAERILCLQISCISNKFGNKSLIFVPLGSLALVQEKQKKYVEAEKNMTAAVAVMSQAKMSPIFINAYQKDLARIQTEKQKQKSTR